MSKQVSIISTPTLEQWDWETPWLTGVGGSEQSHIEMVERLAKRGLPITSYAPLPGNGDYQVGPENVTWRNSTNIEIKDLPPGVIINYRNPTLFDVEKSKEHTYWLIAQDVDYEGSITPKVIENVDRYICLCKQHAQYTVTKYPALRNKICISSNGVRTDYLNKLETAQIKRRKNRLFYASSPDRGLKLLLENWFRIKERFPETELHVAYGFNNMETIAKAVGGTSWHSGYQRELETLLTQGGITFTGRLSLEKLYKEWFESNIWAHPNTFPETSCITCMDAQACGVLPCTTNYWAVGENVAYGYMVDGCADKSEIVKSLWLENLYKGLSSEETYLSGYEITKYREQMITWAREKYDWENVVTQWQVWLDREGIN